MEFKEFNQLLRQRFNQILNTSPVLFKVDLRRGVMWDHYLNSFSDSEVKQSYNCNCCRSFINRYSGVVGINPDTFEIMSIWDLELPEEAAIYKPAVSVMLEEVITSKIIMPLITRDAELGLERSVGTTWHHFSLHMKSNLVYMGEDSEDSVVGRKVGTFNSMRRMFQDWTPSLVERVLDLIEEGRVDRADQWKNQLIELKSLVLQYELLPSHLRANFVWLQSMTKPHLNLKNLSIGLLFKYLIESSSEDSALTTYNALVSPSNYQRTTSAPSQSQLQKAKQKFEELGYLPSLKRRLANADDIPLSASLFVDRSVSSAPGDLDGDMFSGISTKSSSTGKVPKGKPIGIETFLSDVLPSTRSLEIFAEPRYMQNLVTFTAPVFPDAPNIFAWSNPIGYAFIGDAAGAVTIREKVKRAGGKIDGNLRISLAWGKGNTSDYDLNLLEPSKKKIYYGFRRSHYGFLDVDANGGDGIMEEPVENIIYEGDVPEGIYEACVHLYTKRNEKSKGYTLEICYKGKSFFITSSDSPSCSGRGDKTVIFSINNGVLSIKKIKTGLSISEKEHLNDSTLSLWGVSTGTFHRVSQIVLSPNYWEEPSYGNKQYFFVLPNCQVDQPVRPFFKEFIRGDLKEEFGKVFEGLGSNNMIQPSVDSMSGLGFSATDGKVVVFKADGKTYEVTFNYKERFKKEEDGTKELSSNGQSSRESLHV